MSKIDDFGFTEEEKTLIESFEVQELEVVNEVQDFQQLTEDFMNEGFDRLDAEILASKHFAQ
jgi:hypothetical protein